MIELVCSIGGMILQGMAEVLLGEKPFLALFGGSLGVINC
jgi:hypothetical protein